jgi:ubiquinone/menaquinone biosynthesis C-methylase UbiE
MIIPRGAEFHERIAGNWAASYARGGCKHRLELFNSILDRSVMSGQLWLDLGCGSGVLTRELIKRGARVVALDGSPSMLEAALRSVDIAASAQVTFQQGDAQDLSWSEPCAFDGVLCSSVVEYVEDEDELMRQVGRVLKNNGLLIISMPPKRSVVRTVLKVLRRFLKMFGTHRYAYLEVSRFEIDPGVVVGWFRNANMRVDRISGFDPVLPKCLLTIFRPALLVCEARKFEQGHKGLSV